MSTRCMVRVIDTDLNKSVDLYHHWDGYIRGVGHDLIKIFYDETINKMVIFNDVDMVINKILKK